MRGIVSEDRNFNKGCIRAAVTGNSHVQCFEHQNVLYQLMVFGARGLRLQALKM
jgi:hypothetical protein